MASPEQLTVIQGDYNHIPSIEEVLYGVTYVVCFLSETFPKRNRDYPRHALRSWMEHVYPIMKESSVRVVLYQVRFFLSSFACSVKSNHIFFKFSLIFVVVRLFCLLSNSTVKASCLAIDVHEPTPILSQLMKFVLQLQRQSYLQDQDAVIRYMVEHTTNDWFHFIITRPGLVVEGPSRKKLHPSKSVRPT